jgi:hypothetical protein
MTREQLITMRDELFSLIHPGVNALIPVAEWTADDRMTLTMRHLQYQAVVCQLHELDRGEARRQSVELMAEARGHVLAASYAQGLSPQSLRKALDSLTRALMLMGVS